MREQDIIKAVGPTPDIFRQRVASTLQGLKEEQKVKKPTLRTALIAAVILALLLGTAYAVVTGYGLQFWNVERVYKPNTEQTDKLLKAEQTAISGECTNKLVNVTAGQAAWLSDERFQITLTARLLDESKYELHPEQSLDTDGACIPTSEPLPVSENGEPVEERYESFLWTQKGFGLPKDVMDDPSKQLVLFGEGDMTSGTVITIGTPDGIPLDCAASMDDLRSPDGAVQMMLEFDLTYANPEKLALQYEPWDKLSADTQTKSWQNDRSAYEAFVASLLTSAKTQQTAIQNATDADGYLTLVLHSFARLFTADEKGIATFDYANPDDTGTTTFKIKIR